MPRYYTLAKGNNALLPSGQAIWSHEIALCFEPVACPVAFSEDIGHGGCGSVFSAHEALKSQWRQHFVIAGGEWLLPIIEQLANGATVDTEKILRHYRTSYLRTPYSFEAPGDKNQ